MTRAGRSVLGIAACLVITGSAPAAAQLKPETVAAFERYVQVTERRIAGETAAYQARLLPAHELFGSQGMERPDFRRRRPAVELP